MDNAKIKQADINRLKQASLAKARARLKFIGQFDSSQTNLADKTDKSLTLTLFSLIELPSEKERIELNFKELIKRYDKPKSKSDLIRKRYYLHLRDVTLKQIECYANIASERLEYYKYITEKKLWDAEREVCKQNTIHWFKYWAWTTDPRQTFFGWAIPFVLYPYQEEAVTWLEELIFIKRSSGLIDKSRDMGISWLVTSLFYKHWQFSESNFQALIGSMTLDDVDMMGNPSTLFEKLRIQAILQPKFLLPATWDREIPYLKMINPVTKSAIIGESCNWRFGRSGRYSVILFDEFSAVQSDVEAVTSASQSSPCKIYVSTPRGMHNEFAKLRFSGDLPVKSFHWTLHPYKDERWYDFQKLELRDESRIAQELDINYQASTPNRVYPEYDEKYHVITHKELFNELPEFKDFDGRFMIPDGHTVVMGEDVSMGKVSAHVLLWFLILRNPTITKSGRNIGGSVFIYREIVMPPKSTPSITAQAIRQAESSVEVESMFCRYLSNEAITEREIYANEFNLFFKNWKTDYFSGITKIREYLLLYDTDKPHVFRKELNGTPRLFLVVENGQGELKKDTITDQLYVVKPKDSYGLKRIREEFPLYHYPAESEFKEITRLRPKKIFDDAMDILRCVADEAFSYVIATPPEELELKELEAKFLMAKNLPEMEARKIWADYQEKLKNIELDKRLLNWKDKLYQKVLMKSL